jgi:hypothetical protein
MKGNDEVTGLRGAGYRRVIDGSIAKRLGTLDKSLRS